jgi:AcrR family transcriptional regulator
MTTNQAAGSARPYHHGDLRRALLAAAVEELAERGATGLSLRDLARRVGVSHAAPRHHFGDKTGLLTAIAAEGFRLQAERLERAWIETGSFLEVGVAYVGFAAGHRAHFELMYRPELLRLDDPELLAARAASSAMLYGPVRTVPGGEQEPRTAGIAAWALVHGVATLYLSGNRPAAEASDPEALARRVAAHLF